MSATTPAKAMHFLFVAQDPGTHRIQMHIVADSPQICAAWATVHQKRFVTAPKKMAPQTVTAIESLGVGAQRGRKLLSEPSIDPPYIPLLLTPLFRSRPGSHVEILCDPS